MSPVQNKEEKNEVVTNCDHLRKLKFSPSLPNAFTEHGAITVATILNSPVAVKASIQIVRAFVRLREILSLNKELAYKFAELEQKIERHDEEIKAIFDAIRQLMAPPEPKEKKIGFRVRERGAKYRTSRRRSAKKYNEY